MRILLAPIGSEGDVNPFLWLAAGLRDRGHEARLLVSPQYGWLAEAQGLAWSPFGTIEDFRRFADHPHIWDPLKGTEFIIRETAARLDDFRPAYDQAGGPFDLVITSTMGMAISYLAEAQGIPRLLLNLQPICMRSVHEMPLYLAGTEWLNRMPRFVKRAFFAMVDTMLARFMRRPVNAFRRSLGLQPVRNMYWDALMAADHVGLLFPDWFAAPQPDWPQNIRQFGFPLKRPLPPISLDSALEAFLAAGEPPIIWSHGSANFSVVAFQAIALAASLQLGQRCLLVSPEPPSQPLPEGAFHVGHVRFEAVFPRCRAAVNHGGIGTMAKTMAAGIPQLVVPLAHDQPDNAARAEKLGIGIAIPYGKLTVEGAIHALRKLLDSSDTQRRCQEIQRKIAVADPLPELCDWIETIPACRKNR